MKNHIFREKDNFFKVYTIHYVKIHFLYIFYNLLKLNVILTWKNTSYEKTPLYTF